MDKAIIERIDVYAYRQRVGEVMTSPVVTIATNASLQAAAELMRAHRISSLVAVDTLGRPTGIMTERDVITAIARDGATALIRPIEELFSRPVVSVPDDAFLHIAIGRMDRLGIRHLPVVARVAGRLVGILSARVLLRQRAGSVIALGDEIAAASDSAGLAAAYGRLPGLARGLLQEGLSTAEVAGVLSSALRDLSARAAALAEAAMWKEGGGGAPAPWAFLVLGSAGRGESLLAADQDNALVHDGTAADDPWYAELGARACDLLNAAGLAWCAGGVMAKTPACRRSLQGWIQEVDRWVAVREPVDLLNADIFYDFRPVHGDEALAAELRSHAMAAARSAGFLMRLSRLMDARSPALTPILGRFRARAGRVDLKTGGLRSLVAAARLLALKIGAGELSTEGRLAAATEAGLLAGDDLALFRDAHARLQRLILEQQLIDLEAGRSAGSTVDIRRLPRLERERLRTALTAVGRTDLMVRDALGRPI
jgi:CBS domain-containing protein